MRCLLADESIFTGIYVSATDTEGREFPRWRSEKVGSERGDESMLDEKDVFIIKDIVESAIEKNNYILRDEMRENSENLKTELRGEIHSAIEENNELIFDEMERYYQMTHRELEALDKKVTEISDYHRIRKLEDSTSDKLLRLYEQQQEEIEAIKEQLAMSRHAGHFVPRVLILIIVTVQPAPFAKRIYDASPLLCSYFCS